MRRPIIAVLFLTVVTVMPGAHATQAAAPSVVQNYNFSLYRNPPGGGYENFYFFASNSVGGVIAGSTVTPNADFKANASAFVCDANYNCTQTYFNTQQIAPTAFSVDPLGNSIHFVACLAPSTGGNCVNFDFTAVRPSAISQCLACTQIPNVWFDPTGNVVGGSLSVFEGFQRYGYKLAGTFNGAQLSPDLFGQDYFGEYASAIVTATAP